MTSYSFSRLLWLRLACVCAGLLAASVFQFQIHGQGQGLPPGTLIWKFQTGGDVFGAPALSPDGKAVYIGSQDSFLYSIDAVSGVANWSYRAQASFDNRIFSSPAVAADGTIYFGASDWLYALNPNGSLKWTNTTFLFDHNIPGRIFSSPAITHDGRIVVSTFENKRIFTFNPDGTFYGRTNGIDLPANLLSSPAIGVDETIYLGGLDGRLYPIRVNGTAQWTGLTGGPINGSPAIGADGTIYVGSVDNKLYAFAPDGTKRWDYATGDAIFASPVIGPDGTIYIGSWDRRFHAVSPSGVLLWTFQADGIIHSSAAVAADGTIYVPSDLGGSQGRLYALDSRGRKIWEFNTPEQIHASPLIGPDGTVYFGCFDDAVYAIRGSAPPASSAWPMHARTVARPGRANMDVRLADPRSGRTFPAPARVLASALVLRATNSVLQHVEYYLGTNFVARESTFPYSTILNIAQTNRYTIQAKATVQNQDGSSDAVFSIPVAFSVITNQFAPVISFIPDQTTSRQAQIPFTVSDVESPPEELFAVIESDVPSIVPSTAIQLQGTSTNRLLIINPVSGAIPPGGISTKITVIFYDGDQSEPTTKFGRREFLLTVLPPTSPPEIALLSSTVSVPEDLLELEGAPRRVDFSVFDVEDFSQGIELSVSAIPQSQDLIPPGNIRLGGSGFNRFMEFYPGTNQFGNTNIRLVVRDSSGETDFKDLEVQISARDDAPSISAIENLVLSENETSKRVFLTLRDVDSDITALRLVVRTNSNPALINSTNVLFEGTGSSRSLVVRPNSNQAGVAVIGLVATEGRIDRPESAVSFFTVTVNSQNKPPSITSSVNSVTTFEDTPIVPISIQVSDLETPATNLVVTFTTSNFNLVPPSSVRIEGTGTDRRVFLTPATNQFGTNVVRVIVADSQGATNSVSFQLVVTPLNDQPTLSVIPDLTIDEDDLSPDIPFQVSDVETPANELNVQVSSSNPFIIPSGGVTFRSIDGVNRRFSIRPSTNAVGTVSLTMSLFDGLGTSTRTFQVTVNPVNDAPVLEYSGGVIRVIEDQSVPLPQVLASDVDAGTNTMRLTLAATPGTVRFGVTNDLQFVTGTNGSESVQILGRLSSLNAALASAVFTPPANHQGPASIAMVLSDLGASGAGGNLNGNLVLSLDVVPVNDLPLLSSVGDLTLDGNSVSGLIPFTISDVETAAEQLVVSLTSSDSQLLPQSGVEFGGTGTNRTLRLRPAAGRIGSADLALVVADADGGRATNIFKLTVRQVAFPPSMVSPVTVTIAEDAAGGSGPLPLVLADVDTPINSVTVNGFSSNTNLIDNAGIVLAGTGTNRTLTLLPRPDRSGAAVISLIVSDGLFTATNTVDLTVTPVNDPPTISGIADAEVLEDSGVVRIPFAGVSAGPVDENQNAVVTVSVSGSTQLGLGTVIHTNGAPAGFLEFVLVTNAFGNSPVSVFVSDGLLQVTNTFVLRVKPVNDAPVFIPGPDITLLEGAGAQSISSWAGGISAGPTNESAQTVRFEVTTTNLAMFAVAPSIDGSGTLRFTPAPGAVGSAVVVAKLLDDGGTQDGGVDASPAVSFRILLSPVNNAPAFVKGPDVSVLEDSGAVSFPGWATGIHAGAPDESAQALSFVVTNDSPALFLSRPVVSRDGTLSFTPAPNAFGSAKVFVRLRDDGGTANGGVDLSEEQSFTLTILPVNDAPTLDPIPDLAIDEDSGQTGVELRNLSFGPAIENQTLTVTATSSNKELLPDPQIRVTPGSNSSLVLLLPNTNAFGTSVVTLRVRDNGGTNNGGMDETTQSFTLTVLPVDDTPQIAVLPDVQAEEGKPTQPVTIQISDIDTPVEKLVLTGSASDPTLLPAGSFSFSGTGPVRSLVMTPVSGLSGTTRVSIVVSDENSSSSSSFNLIIQSIDRPPRLSGITTVSMLEDSSSTPLNFTIVDPDTAVSNLVVTASSSDLSMIGQEGLVLAPATQAAGETNWVLRITPKPDRAGQAQVRIEVRDRTTLVFGVAQVNIQPVNDAPSFVGQGDVSVLEDSGAVSRAAWATSIRSGPSDESGQLLRFAVTNNLPSLFAVQPSLSPDGTLSFVPATNAFGVAAVTARLLDDGGRANGGEDQSAERVFQIRVNPVNDQPTLNSINNLTRDEDSGLFTLRLSGITSGATNENQVLVVTATSSNPAILPNPVVTYASPATNGTLAFTPPTNSTGTVSIRVKVRDDGGVSDGGQDSIEREFTLRLDPINDAPVISSIADQSTPENTTTLPISFQVLDVDNEPAQLQVTASSSNTALIPNDSILFSGNGTNRTFTITPRTNQTGTATISVAVSDGLLSATTSFVLTVTVVNTPPSLLPVPDQAMDEDGRLTVTLSPFDRETAAGQLLMELASANTNLVGPANLTLATAGTNRVLTITPVANANGVTDIRIVVGDGRFTATNTFKLTVRPVDDPPTLGALASVVTRENTPTDPVAISLADPDTPLDQVTLTASSSDPGLVAPGGFRFTGTGPLRTLTITPGTNRVGQATISVVAADLSSRVTNQFQLTVQQVNQPPTIQAISDQTVNEDQSISIPLTVSDRESAAGGLQITFDTSSPAVLPVAGVTLSGAGTNRELTLRPAPDASGESSINLIVSDGSLSATNRFKLTVLPVNDAPRFAMATNLVVLEDAGRQSRPGWASAISAGAPDEVAQRLQFVVTNNSPALFVEQPAIGPDGTLTFVAATNAFGQASVGVVLQDDGGTVNGGENRSVLRSFTISIEGVNDAPTLNPLNNLTRDEDSGVFTLRLSGISSGATNENQVLTVTAVSSLPGVLPNPQVAYTSPANTGVLTFTPGVNATGTAVITVRVRDDGGVASGGADTVERVFTLRLDPVNDAPTIADIGPKSTAENTASAPIQVIIADVDNEAGQLTVTAISSNKSLVPDAALSLSGTGGTRELVAVPSANQTGETTISVVVSDGLLSATTTFVLSVISVDQPPVLVPIGDRTMAEDSVLQLEVVISDRETAPELLTLSASSGNPGLFASTNVVLGGSGGTRSLRLTPATNQSGTGSIRLILSDGRFSVTNDFNVLVVPVDDPPVLGSIPSQPINQDGVSAAIALTISDPDTALSDLVVTAEGVPAQLLPASGLNITSNSGVRSLQITPARGQSGTGTVTVVVRDSATTVRQSFSVVVAPPNTPPSIVSQPASRTVLTGTTVVMDVTAVGTAPLSYRWSVNGTNLPTATNAVLVLPNVSASASGRYAVRVSNQAGSVLSEEAVLIVGQLGSKLWDVVTGGQIRSSAALGPDGTVYLGSDDFKLHALTPFGQRKWEFGTGGPIISSPLVANGTVFVGSSDGILYAIHTNGTVRWQYQADAAINSSPAIGSDGTLYFGTDGNRLYAVRDDGTLRWSVSIGGLIYSSPAVDSNGNVYFGGYDNRLHAVDRDGRPLWDFATGGVVASSPAIGSDGTIYVGSADKRLYALRPDGTRLWQYAAPAAITGSPVVAQDGTIFVGTEDGRLIAVNAEGGRRWEFVSGGPIYGAPVLGRDGTVYLGSFDSKLYAVNPNGTKRWEFATGGPIYAAPSLDRDGVIYVGSFDGRIYGIRGTTGLADGPWPMFHRDAQHTGLVPGGSELPLRITSIQALAGGGIELLFSGTPNRTVSVEVSTNLIDWLKLESVTLNGSGAGTVLRDLLPGAPMFFYRLKVP